MPGSIRISGISEAYLSVETCTAAHCRFHHLIGDCKASLTEKRETMLVRQLRDALESFNLARIRSRGRPHRPRREGVVAITIAIVVIASPLGHHQGLIAARRFRYAAPTCVIGIGIRIGIPNAVPPCACAIRTFDDLQQSAYVDLGLAAAVGQQGGIGWLLGRVHHLVCRVRGD